MPLYRYAFDSAENLVDVFDLSRHTDERLGPFVCVSCEGSLTPRLGEIREKHFAHKAPERDAVSGFCSFETYLHKTAKLIFKQTFEKCVQEGIAYNVEVRREVKCTGTPNNPGTALPVIEEPCEKGKEMVPHDLAALYDTVEMEVMDGPFRPDLRLTDSRGLHPKLWVEMRVSSPVSRAKKDSGTEILEIIIDREKEKGEAFITDYIGVGKIPPESKLFHNKEFPLLDAAGLACGICIRYSLDMAEVPQTPIITRDPWSSMTRPLILTIPEPVRPLLSEPSERITSRSLYELTGTHEYICRHGIFFQINGEGVPSLREGIVQDMVVEWRRAEPPRDGLWYSRYACSVKLPPQGPWQLPLTILSDMAEQGREIPRHCLLCEQVETSRQTVSMSEDGPGSGPYDIALRCRKHGGRCGDERARACPDFVVREV